MIVSTSLDSSLALGIQRNVQQWKSSNIWHLLGLTGEDRCVTNENGVERCETGVSYKVACSTHIGQQLRKGS